MKGLCGTCKNMVYCTYKAEGGARWCDEFEDAGSAAQHEWDLQALLKLHHPPEAEIGNQPNDA